MSITRITITIGSSKPRKTYHVGDTRKRGRTTYIKQFRITRDPMHGWCYQSRRGKLLTEWVVKDGPRDRESPNFKRMIQCGQPADKARNLANQEPNSTNT